MKEKIVLLVLLSMFLSPNLFPENTRNIETSECYSDSEYFRVKAQDSDGSVHNLILLINALNELVEMNMVSIISFEGKNSFHTKTSHDANIGNSIVVMSSEMNIITRMDDQFFIEFLAIDYTISMKASINDQNIIYNEQVNSFESIDDLVFSAWGSLKYNGFLVYNLLDVDCEKVLYCNIEELNDIYNLITDYLQELGFAITVGSNGDSKNLCLKISLYDARQSINFETNN